VVFGNCRRQFGGCARASVHSKNRGSIGGGVKVSKKQRQQSWMTCWGQRSWWCVKESVGVNGSVGSGVGESIGGGVGGHVGGRVRVSGKHRRRSWRTCWGSVGGGFG